VGGARRRKDRTGAKTKNTVDTVKKNTIFWVVLLRAPGVEKTALVQKTKILSTLLKKTTFRVVLLGGAKAKNTVNTVKKYYF
jgi:hypothetical protein